MFQEKETIKDLFEWLKKQYKYVRLIELNFAMKLVHKKPKFKEFILASNELEEYNDLDLEKENLKVKVAIANVRLLFVDFVHVITPNERYIPIFLLDKKVKG